VEIKVVLISPQEGRSLGDTIQKNLFLMTDVFKKAIKLTEEGVRTLAEEGTFKLSPKIIC
jgi:hypothetical protein